MNSLADSDSFYSDDRLLPQHQAVLTIIKNLLDNPRQDDFRWLDLACGKGQLITHLDRILSTGARAKISYVGYEINNESARNAQRRAESLGLKSVTMEIGELSSFGTKFSVNDRFDFITFINTFHELQPFSFAKILYEAVFRLSGTGSVFMYDLETLSPLELGAIVFTAPEIKEVVTAFLESLGVIAYKPEPGHWRHKNSEAWDLQISKAYLGIDDAEINRKRLEVIEATERKIKELLTLKLQVCRSSLESLTKFGAENEAEEIDKERQVFDFFALCRALEDK